MDKERDIQLSFNELLRICDSEPQWVISLIEEEIITISGDPQQATFSGYQLSRIRRAQRISRDFEASVPATGLILHLLDELEKLRKLTQ